MQITELNSQEEMEAFFAALDEVIDRGEAAFEAEYFARKQVIDIVLGKIDDVAQAFVFGLMMDDSGPLPAPDKDKLMEAVVLLAQARLAFEDAVS